MKKRIAVAFFGIPRFSQTCAPSIEENILGCFKQSGALVKGYYHLYDIEQIDNNRSKEKGTLDKSNYRYFEQFDGEIEKPGECLGQWGFEGIKKYGDYWDDDFRSLSNLIHQLHSLRQVTNRINDFEPDIVAYVRPDLLYKDKISEDLISLCLQSPKTVVLPDWQWWTGYNDRLSICGKDVYEVYGNRMLEASKYCQVTNKPLHSEKLLKYVLDKSNCNVATTKVRANRVRIDGSVVDENFNSFRTAGSISNRLNLTARKFFNRPKVKLDKS